MLKSILAILFLWSSSAFALPYLDCTEESLTATNGQDVLLSLGDSVIQVGEDAGSRSVEDFCHENEGFAGFVLPVPKPTPNDDFPEIDLPKFEDENPLSLNVNPPGPTRTSSFSVGSGQKMATSDSAEGNGLQNRARFIDSVTPRGPLTTGQPTADRDRAEPAPTTAGGCTTSDTSNGPLAVFFGLLMLGLRRRGGAK